MKSYKIVFGEKFLQPYSFLLVFVASTEFLVLCFVSTKAGNELGTQRRGDAARGALRMLRHKKVGKTSFEKFEC